MIAVTPPRVESGVARAAARTALLAVATLSFLAGCADSSPPPAPPEPVRPALIHTVGNGDGAAKLRFPGRLRAVRRAELSFDVPGFVAEFAPAEGAQVRAGQIVARLDNGVYRARVEAARAEFERARTDLARYQRLWETELAVARSEVDDRRSRLEAARTKLAEAEEDLAATVIKAPFAGVITRRRLETFANVQAKQAIADLQDLKALEVVINVPERLIRAERAQKRAYAVIEGGDGRHLPLTLKSYAPEADLQTQTYEIVLSLDQLPADIMLLPGMPITVAPYADVVATSPIVTIPLTAISAEGTGKTLVWQVGDDGSVSRREVSTGDIRGADIDIRSGLAPGDRVIAAGLGALREGMKVRPLDPR